ncbi:acyltransferase family protein [Demequina mangrovi]
MLFYLLFPLLIVWIGRRSKAQVWWIAGAACVAALACGEAARAVAGSDAFGGLSLYVFPPARLPEFVLGICAALLVRHGLPRVPMALAGALLLGSYLVVHVLPASDGYGSVRFWSLPIALMIVATAQADIAGVDHPFRRGMTVRLGQWSFAFYLVHAVVVTVVGELVFAGESATLAAVLIGVVVAFGGSLLLSWLLFTYVETPAERAIRASTWVPRLPGRAQPSLD